ncbi:MAG: radical SAM protein [Thermodesulfobacteriota bacterium]
MQAPLCKVIDTPRGVYAYDACSNHILRIDGGVRRLIGELAGEPAGPLAPGERARAETELNEARSKGYLLPARHKVLCFDDAAFANARRELTELGPDHLTLAVTEQCNFRCRYCLYSGAYLDQRVHSSRRMSPGVLDAALEWYFSHTGREKFSLSFYGGEPLLEAGLIRRAVETVRRKGRDTDLRLTTNASLIDEDTARFLAGNGFHVLVSLDGPAFLHDRFRRMQGGGPSFEATWRGVQTLRKVDPAHFEERVRFNMVLPPPVDLEAIHRFVLENPGVFAKSHIRASLLNNSPSELPPELDYAPHRQALKEQFARLTELFASRLAEGPGALDPFLTGLLLVDFVPVHMRPLSPIGESFPSLGQCVPCRPKAYVGVDGDLRVCERLPSSLPMGDVFKGLDIEAALGFMEAYNGFLAPRCEGCWAIRLCNKCAANLTEGGVLSARTLDAFCPRAREFWAGKLADYASILETKPGAFDWVDQELASRD